MVAPAVTKTEISRVVYDARTGTMDRATRAEARSDQEYALDAACVSEDPGRSITYELLSVGPASTVLVGSGEVPCDGTAIRNSMPLPATTIQISFRSGLNGVTAAYAVLAPLYDSR